jgi:hypothetical protein
VAVRNGEKIILKSIKERKIDGNPFGSLSYRKCSSFIYRLYRWLKWWFTYDIL